MKISIITATYNSQKTIQDCLQSLIDQTYDNIEHIVVDGGSTDNTVEIIKNSSSVTKWISESNRGIFDALNKGIKLSTGMVICFLHADDTFASNTVLGKIANAFENKTVYGVYGNLDYIGKGGKVVRKWRSKQYHPKDIRNGWMPPHPTLFLKRKVYEELGNYDVRFKIADDYDYILRILTHWNYDIRYLPFVITNMQIGGASNKNPRSILQQSFEDYIAIRKNGIGGIGVLLRKNLSKIPQFF